MTSESKEGKEKDKDLENGGWSSSEGEDEHDDSVIRCPCGSDSNRGMMIQCETCLVWQHSLCVGIREQKAVPKNYYCELCSPRSFKCLCDENKPNGKMIQCTQCSTWQHTKCLGRNLRTLPKPYRCLVCDPNILTKRARSAKKKKTKDLFKFILYAELRENLEDDFETFGSEKLERVEIADVVQRYCIHFCDLETEELRVEELLNGMRLLVGKSNGELKGVFQKTLHNIIHAKVEHRMKKEDLNNWEPLQENLYNSKDARSNPMFKQVGFTQWPKSSKDTAVEIQQVSLNQWGLVAQEPILSQEMVIEYKGKVGPLSESDYWEIPPRERLFVLYRPRLGECIDARQTGNKARFVRRSCSPNSEIKESILENQMRIALFATESISKNREITVNFDFEWKEQIDVPPCACPGSNCLISTWFQKRRTNAKRLQESFKSLPSLSESEDESSSERKSKKKAEGLIEGLRNTSRGVSREDRKIAMIEKSFQSIEKRGKKRKVIEDDEPSKQNSVAKPEGENRTNQSFPKKKHLMIERSAQNGASSLRDGPLKGSTSLPRSPKHQPSTPQVYASNDGVKRESREPQPKQSQHVMQIPKPTQEVKQVVPQASPKAMPSTQEPARPAPAPTLESPRLTHKFGKKAWILEFQEHQKEASNGSPPDKAHGSARPLKDSKEEAVERSLDGPTFGGSSIPKGTRPGAQQSETREPEGTQQAKLPCVANIPHHQNGSAMNDHLQSLPPATTVTPGSNASEQLSSSPLRQPDTSPPTSSSVITPHVHTIASAAPSPLPPSNSQHTPMAPTSVPSMDHDMDIDDEESPHNSILFVSQHSNSYTPDKSGFTFGHGVQMHQQANYYNMYSHTTPHSSSAMYSTNNSPYTGYSTQQFQQQNNKYPRGTP